MIVDECHHIPATSFRNVISKLESYYTYGLTATPFRKYNDINIRADFSFRDDKTINYKLDQNIAEPTRGNKTFSFSPTIDYVVNQKLNVRLFYDFRKTKPATLASYPITSHRGGVTIRFSLAP